jgi:hypothetical protein
MRASGGKRDSLSKSPRAAIGQAVSNCGRFCWTMAPNGLSAGEHPESGSLDQKFTGLALSFLARGKIGTMRKPWESLNRWIRERRFAGDGRSGAWSGRKALDLRYDFVKRKWPFVLAGPLLAIIVCPVVLLMPHWVRQFALGVILSSGIWLAFYLVESMSGAMPPAMGQLAEQWTARELRRLRPRGWLLANEIRYRPFMDIDHILLGPGGALVVETKYAFAGWGQRGYSDRVLADAAERVADSANDFWLTSKATLAHGLVRPIVVLWGGGYDEGRPSPRDDFLVLPGPKLREWLTQLPTAGLEENSIQSIYA